MLFLFFHTVKPRVRGTKCVCFLLFVSRLWTCPATLSKARKKKILFFLSRIVQGIPFFIDAHVSISSLFVHTLGFFVILPGAGFAHPILVFLVFYRICGDLLFPLLGDGWGSRKVSILFFSFWFGVFLLIWLALFSPTLVLWVADPSIWSVCRRFISSSFLCQTNIWHPGLYLQLR